MNKEIFVVSTEHYPNCPVHDGGFDSGLKVFYSERGLIEYALTNLNENHITNIVLIKDGEKSDDEYRFKYEPSSHSYVGIEVLKNEKPIFRTIDNGSGTKVWDEL